MRDNTGKVLGTAISSHLGPDAGGFCTSYDITNDGQLHLHGTDVGNGYWRLANSDQWRPMISYDNYPDLDNLPGVIYRNGNAPGNTDASGVYACAVGKTGGQKAYFHFRGSLFRTADRFATVQRVPGRSYVGHSNGGDQRISSPKMATDSLNPDVFVFCPGGERPVVSLDGGLTEPTQIMSLPIVTTGSGSGGTYTPYPSLVACDDTSEVANGVKQRWAVHVPGYGTYVSTTGPAGPYSLSAGSQTNQMRGMVYAHGVLYLSDAVMNVVRKLDGNGWGIEVGSLQEIRSFAVDRTNPLRKFIVGENGTFVWTNADGGWPGDTFRPNYPLDNSVIYTSEEVRWLNKPYRAQIFASTVVADPVTPNKFWIAHGTGICYTTPPTPGQFSGQPLYLRDWSKGNAMLVTWRAVSQTNGRILRTAWDKPLWIGKTDEELDNPVRYRPSVGLEHGWDIDWLPGNEDFLLLCSSWNNNASGKSLDAGDTWMTFVHPDGIAYGGNLVFCTPTEGYWIPFNNMRALKTLDGGATWDTFSITTAGGVSLPTSGERGWMFAYYFNRKILVASKEEPGVVYLYNYGPTGAEALRGIWRKEAGAQTFVQVFAGTFPGTSTANYFYHASLTEIPGHAGELLFSSGGDQNGAPLIRSNDRGVTWAPVQSRINGAGVLHTITAVAGYGYGKAASGRAYPTIRLFGVVNGTRAIWETQDNFASIVLIENRPMGLIEWVNSIAGDLTTFGRWVYGVGQLGWAKSVHRHRVRIR